MSPEALQELIFTIANNLVSEGKAGTLTAEELPDAAMQLAKKAGMKPRDLAQLFADALNGTDGIAAVEVAGPGFINITLDSASAAAVVDQVLDEGNRFGKNNHLSGKTLNLEFVSANPTGPIHIGGTRWAAVGDSMARILQANGATVVREYYFNDHGEQINRFAKSLVAAAHDEPTPVDGYKGAYFDVWFHENSLYEDGEVEKAIADLRNAGDIYEKDGATWFESTEHGDDKDRVIIKSDGTYAYFAADIAYYRNKRHRKTDPADVAIYMLGADHHGYIGRMMAMCAAFGDKPGENMQILIGQMVNVMKDGKPVRMSKRAGNIVTIDDLIDAIGVDASRYSLARTDYNSPVDIDLNLLASHSNDNPVYYVQYAHARSCNVDRNAEAAQINAADADLSLLDTEADGEVIAALAQWPALLTLAGDLRAPHRIAHYLEDLAAAYHKWYNVERVVPMPLTEAEERADEQTRERTRIAKNPEPARAAARLKLNDAVQTVIAEGLDLLGVTAPDKM